RILYVVGSGNLGPGRKSRSHRIKEYFTLVTAPLPPDALFGIYLHIPFCARICPYCDFNTYAHKEDRIPDYVEALIREMDLTQADAGRVTAETVFFGGGTPSLLPPDAVARLIEALRARFAIAPDAEVTLEVNPETIDARSLAAFREAGINRLSIGVQSQQLRGLRVLGRGHRPETAQNALRTARVAGFDNVSLDLIFGWPGQTIADWEGDLNTVLDWSPEHLSLYSLIVEPGTPMHDAVRRGIMITPDDDATADMYELAISRLAAAGWHHYEISNWARTPDLISRHNRIYWRNGRYLGLGAGAHAHVGHTRSSNLLLPETYIDTVFEGRLPVARSETLDEVTAMGETMMLGLRLLQEGVSVAAFQQRHGKALLDIYGHQIKELAGIGLLTWDGERVRLTHRGLLLANDVAARFLPESAAAHR
ncbi:MAG TPA: radical SAM family heme chaperone HemW, partial [Nitrolancea sp.]|nr:radical SAM family heme chaperone HemW [Nitrolancea sp.]